MRKLFYITGLIFVILGSYQLRPVPNPGKNYTGPLPALTEEQQRLKSRLYKHVNALSNQIGERHFLIFKNLSVTERYIRDVLRYYGIVPMIHHNRFEIHDYPNIIAEIKGRTHPEQIVIVGAHYDTVATSVGADYNASGVAALMELANYYKRNPSSYTIRFIAFANKEPPFAFGPNMGSLRYAKLMRKNKQNIIAMYALEGLAYFSTEAHSQRYPYFLGLFRCNVGDFIGFMSNYNNARLLQQSLDIFRLHSHFPSEGLTVPDFINSLSGSDHWSFWQAGFPAIMITDTLFYRNKNYLRETDTINTLDFDRLTRVVVGLEKMLTNLHIEPKK